MEITNIATHLTRMAKSQPESLAVIIQQKINTYKEYNYRILEEHSNKIAAGLLHHGIKKGTRVAVMVQPGFEFFGIIFALFKIGAVLVAIDPGLGLKGLKQCLFEAEPEVFIGNLKAHIARLLFKWGKQTIYVKISVSSLTTLFSGVITLQTIIDSTKKTFNSSTHITEKSYMAAILFTSGSTGIPKGVVYSHSNFLAQVEALKNQYDIKPGEVDLATFPLFALYAPAMGMTSIIPDMNFTRPGRASPLKLISAIKKYNATTMFGSPALINRTGKWAVKNNIKLPTLKRVLSAGAPVSPQVLEIFTNILMEGIEIFTPYGATECLPVSSIGSLEILAETRGDTEAGKGICVGKPVKGMLVSIYPITNEAIQNWDTTRVLGDYRPGEIVVHGPQVTSRYYNRTDETKQSKIYSKNGDIYHRMGDTGYFDDSGRLWFCGRKTHCVVYKKEIYFSICCEGVFNVHEKIFRTALIGINRNGHTVPALCVEMEDEYYGDDKKQLKSELLELGGRYEHTCVIKEFFFHPSFPVDIRHNAKIDRVKLGIWANNKST
ncbi:MAG: fatty acid CoA ligase family protein [Gammaproteobacteria bacterium]|jgi:acyl-CoA synthetase (AMP-forming)/AMP-acid ligase II